MALTNDKVDRHMANRRKSVHYEKHQLNKELEENVMKRTPSLEEYLDKSQNKYSTWKEREKERLDRRYRNLHRAYLKDFKSLGLDDYVLEIAEKKRRKSESDASGEAVNEDKETNDSVDGKDSVTFENDEKMSEEEALMALDRLNLEMNKRRFSETVGAQKYHGRRRGSTGSIDLAEFTKLRSLHLALTTVAEDSTAVDSKAEKEETEMNENRDADDSKNKNRFKSVTPENDDDDDISAEDLVVRPKRRATVATTPNIKSKVEPVSIPKGARLDRRPSLPHCAIPFNYGN